MGGGADGAALGAAASDEADATLGDAAGDTLAMAAGGGATVGATLALVAGAAETVTGTASPEGAAGGTTRSANAWTPLPTACWTSRPAGVVNRAVTATAAETNPAAR